MGTSTHVKRTEEVSGEQLAAFQSAVDSTLIQKVAATDDDGSLLGAQANPFFTLPVPDARSACMERETKDLPVADTDYTVNIPDDAYYMILFTADATGAIYAVDLTTASGVTGDGLVLRQSTERKHVLEPGTSRVLHLQSSGTGTDVVCEFM